MALPKPSSSESSGWKLFWTPGRIVLTLIGCGLVAALGLSSCNSNDAPTTSNAPANRAANAPPTNAAPAQPPAAFVDLPPGLRDTTVPTLEGGSLKLADFADKVVILNIWATWCGPCRLEMPELVKMSNEYKARGLVVLGIATTYNEHNDQAHVKEYVKSQNVPYKIIWDDGTLSAPLVQAVAGRSVIPQSFVISRDGRIIKHFQGFDPYSTPQKMRQAIEEALNDKGKA
ncbi:MAG TPA: TlpA disulfide reductase family protein [Pyrinomonadaceae bacterium]|nr:TlpA disulfide reductase family protein [Pyrinomonadaceae bacterium]